MTATSPDAVARKRARNNEYMRERSRAMHARGLTDTERAAKKARDARRSQWRLVHRRFTRLLADLGAVSLAERRQRAGL